MTSDFPDDLGPGQAGLDQLITMLTSGPAREELAGEQQALAMFRANIHPPANDTVGMPVPVASPAAPGRAGGPAPGGNRPRPPRRFGSARLRLRLVAGATTAALVGGVAAAAYAAALPAPVQHLVYDALHRIGVPDTQRGRVSGGPVPGSGLHPSLHPSSTGAGGRTGSASSPPASRSPNPGASRSGAPHPTASPSGSASAPPPGSAAIVAAAAATQIPAGSAATIDGTLTRSGKAVAGVTVTLWERPAGRLKWHRAGQAATGSAGAVAISSGSLATNAAFRLTDQDGPVSTPVAVTVVPDISTSLTKGAKGVWDYVTVTTQYAQAGDTVALREFEAGAWVTIRTRPLTAGGSTTFTLAARKFSGVQLQVVLRATRLHAKAVSPSFIV
jgi:hypothetical protein